MKTPPSLLCDFYKVSHREQYPQGTQVVYSTWTPRSNKYAPWANEVVVFSGQAFIQKYLIDYFHEHFFSVPFSTVVAEYKRYIKWALGVKSPYTKHIEDLWVLGYLPLEIKSLPEGSSVPLRCPMITVKNTHPDFFWLTNFIETLFSCSLWQASTSATIAKEYYTILKEAAEFTGGSLDFVKFQGHDFSMRGMGSLESAAMSGAGHLLSFCGTDTIPAIGYLEEYYNASMETELIGTSIPATEHSVMCAGGNGSEEFNTYKRLISEVYPVGFVSVVSDTWDLWSCIRDIITPLRDTIMEREGKVVIRPDSGDPVEILCGIPELYLGKSTHGYVDKRTGKSVSKEEVNGLVATLYDIFGGSINGKGYIELDNHIGCIYGDSITLDRCREICEQLADKGFASTSVVLGIGSYTYQYNTRDTFGFAFKSTAVIINGEEKMIFKNPKTDDGTKKSNKGAVAVIKQDGTYKCIDELSINSKYPGDCLETIFLNGELVKQTSLSEIRSRMV